MSGPFLATFGLVLVAEVVGDKLLYTTGVLATRYASAPIVFGIAAAFMAKMGAAVLIGAAISKLPPLVVATVTSASFLGIAYTLWRTPDRQASAGKPNSPNSKVALVSFVAIFLSEWGDPGQLAAATMAAQYRTPFIVWLGAVCAMVTKGVLAASVGAAVRNRIRDRVPPRAVTLAATGAVVVLGAFSVVEILVNRSQLPR
jgi:putative Ca2+/H+ antiporter (TMEM165/GDT1 family)